jgi:hypothetical protein
MAKCMLCKTRKGQRECQMAGAAVCSVCCGQHRQKEACEGCHYYREIAPKASIRDYRAIPRFSPERMNADLELQSYSNTIESALCLWDRSMDCALSDNSALTVLERLLDRYHFKEDTVQTLDKPSLRGFDMVLSAIRKDLGDLSDETLVKILGVIYFVARRRARGGRDYFEVINRYVGMRAGPGVRILKM